MSQPTVYAVMKATVEIPVRSSSSNETFAQMHDAAKREARLILHNTLSGKARIIGDVEFSYATVKGGTA